LTFSQNFVETDFPLKYDKIIFEETVNTEANFSADDLYINYHKWLIDNFDNYKTVVQFDDRATKTIIIKCYFPVVRANYDKFKVWFTLYMEIDKNECDFKYLESYFQTLINDFLRLALLDLYTSGLNIILSYLN
jgi:hypothetical protein